MSLSSSTALPQRLVSLVLLIRYLPRCDNVMQKRAAGPPRSRNRPPQPCVLPRGAQQALLLAPARCWTNVPRLRCLGGFFFCLPLLWPRGLFAHGSGFRQLERPKYVSRGAVHSASTAHSQSAAATAGRLRLRVRSSTRLQLTYTCARARALALIECRV